MSSQFLPPFPTLIPARFVERPNRFILHCQLPGGQQVRAFLPNPGRLQELLLPDVPVYLAPADENSGRKTAYTAVGVAGELHPVFLHTHVNNAVARHLIESGKIPGFRHANILRAEVPIGHSRFDFLLGHRGEEVYLEVKSCTLFGNRVAMFPDAVTDRGRRHLEELAALSHAGTRAVVLFVVHSAEVDWFMPDFHTDPAFSQTLLDVREHVRILPMAVSWNEDFSLAEECRLLKIPWNHIAREMGDRGNYLLVCESRGGNTSPWRPGYYLIVGWCPSALGQLLRKIRKVGHAAPVILPEGAHLAARDVLPIVSSQDRLPEMYLELGAQYAQVVSTVCPTKSLPPCHLFHTPTDPLRDRAFHQFLARFRMAQPRVPF